MPLGILEATANTCRMAPTASRYTLLPAARRNWSRVVFPTYCSTKGTRRHLRAPSTFPRLLYEMLEVLLDQIARNGFKKS